MKAFRLALVLLVTCLFTGVTYAKSTMIWEMLPNESLVELAAKFYPKSGAMQRAFISKTQQLNQGAQVYADAHARYPNATKIVIPTLESLSVKGTSGKKYKRKKSKRAKKSQEEPASGASKKKAGVKKASVKNPMTADAQGKEQALLVEKKKLLDESLARQNAGLKSLESKVNALQKQLEQTKQAPTKPATEMTAPKKPAASQSHHLNF